MELNKEILYRYCRESATWRTVMRYFAHPVHAYLFTGEDSLALQAIVDLACTRVYCPLACGQCVECRKVLDRNKMDVRFVNQWDEVLKVKAVGDLIDDALLSAFEGGKKVYVIHSFDRQSERVQNMLLKTLEEPNKDVLFLLTATSTAGILATVQSRVKPLAVAPFPLSVLTAMLQEMGVADAETLARCGGGNFTRSWQLSTDESYFFTIDEVFSMLLFLDTLGQVCEYIYQPIFAKENIAKTVGIMQILFCDLLYWQTGLTESITYRNKTTDYSHLADKYSVDGLAKIGELIEEARSKINSNCTAANIADSLLGAVLEVKSK